jgi:hypothetical protein
MLEYELERDVKLTSVLKAVMSKVRYIKRCQYNSSATFASATKP